MIIRTINKVRCLAPFLFFAMGFIVAQELQADNIYIDRNINPFKLYPKGIDFEV